MFAGVFLKKLFLNFSNVFILKTSIDKLRNYCKWKYLLHKSTSKWRYKNSRRRTCPEYTTR